MDSGVQLTWVPLFLSEEWQPPGATWKGLDFLQHDPSWCIFPAFSGCKEHQELPVPTRTFPEEEEFTLGWQQLLQSLEVVFLCSRKLV